MKFDKMGVIDSGGFASKESREAKTKKTGKLNNPKDICAVAEEEKSGIGANSRETSDAPDNPDPEVELVRHAARVLGTSQMVWWMREPVPALDHRTPWSLMETAEGRRKVERVLGQIEHGIF